MISYDGASIAANYFVSNKESLGGKIFFDSAGMRFKSHLLNLHQRNFILEYKHVEKAEQYALGIAKTGMLVTEEDGTKHIFAVNHRDDVIAFLNYKASAKTADAPIDADKESSPLANETPDFNNDISQAELPEKIVANNATIQEPNASAHKKKSVVYLRVAIVAIILAVFIVFGYRIVNERNMKSALWEDLWNAQETAITDYYAELLNDNYFISTSCDNCEIKKNSTEGFDASFPIEISDATAEGRRSYYPKIIAEVTPNFFRSRAEIKSYVEYDPFKYMQISFQSLQEDIDSNKLRAEQTYLNQKIEITGCFDRAFDRNGDYYFNMCSDQANWIHIECHLTDNNQLQTVLDLNNDDIVTVRGTLIELYTSTELGSIEVDEMVIDHAVDATATMPDPLSCYQCDAYVLIGELGAGNFAYGDWIYVNDFWASEKNENNYSATMYCCNYNITAPDIPVYVEFASADEFNNATYRSEPCDICGLLEEKNGAVYLKNAVFCKDSSITIQEQNVSIEPSELAIRNTIVYNLTYDVPSGQEENVWIFGDLAHEMTCNTIAWELGNVKHSINSSTMFLDAENIPAMASTLESSDYFVVVSSEDVCRRFLQNLLENGCSSTVMGQGYGYLWGVIDFTISP